LYLANIRAFIYIQLQPSIKKHRGHLCLTTMSKVQEVKKFSCLLLVYLGTLTKVCQEKKIFL